MSQASKLRALLDAPGIITAPGCYDAMSTRLIEKAGFPAAFMSGFAVSAARLGMPDTGLISYSEMVDQVRNLCDAVTFPVICDGDTGFGNAVNIHRTVKGYAQAGAACVMIEDQVSPKRCGHTRGKQIVSRAEANARIQAAVDAREEGADILVMARTDANATDGIEEGIHRCNTFREIGADITFLEAPLSKGEMRRYCEEVEGPKMANMVPGGDSPYLAPQELEELGYKVVIYPIVTMLAGIQAMEQTLVSLRGGEQPELDTDFPHLRDLVGFPEYYEAEQKYAAE